MSDKNLTPTAKVGQIPIAGAALIVITYVASLFGLDIPAEVGIAVVALVTFIIGYYIKDRRTPDPETPIRADNLYAENDHSEYANTSGTRHDFMSNAAIDVVDYQSGYAAGHGNYAVDTRTERSNSWMLGYTRGQHESGLPKQSTPKQSTDTEGPDHRA